MHVHNLSAVGEQYLDFEPPDNKPPYAKAGDVIQGDESSLPTSEEVLLTQMNSLVQSVDGAELSTVIGEAGTMFRGTANPLQRMVDSGSQFVDAAAASSDDTITLLDTGRTVLQTQADHEKDIQTFARGLADLTGTLRTSDKDIRTILQGGPPAVREVNSLLKGLEPTLPVFLSNLVTTNQVLTANLPALEQMLVVFPHVIAAGFTGTPGDGYGHINLQFNNNVPPCTKGYKPPSQWRPATDTTRRADLPGPVQVRAAPGHARLQLRAEVGRRRVARPGLSGRRRTMRGREQVDTGDGRVAGRRHRRRAAHGVRGRRMEVDADGTGDGR